MNLQILHIFYLYGNYWVTCSEINQSPLTKTSVFVSTCLYIVSHSSSSWSSLCHASFSVLHISVILPATSLQMLANCAFIWVPASWRLRKLCGLFGLTGLSPFVFFPKNKVISLCDWNLAVQSDSLILSYGSLRASMTIWTFACWGLNTIKR